MILKMTSRQACAAIAFLLMLTSEFVWLSLVAADIILTVAYIVITALVILKIVHDTV